MLTKFVKGADPLNSFSRWSNIGLLFANKANYVYNYLQIKKSIKSTILVMLAIIKRLTIRFYTDKNVIT